MAISYSVTAVPEADLDASQARFVNAVISLDSSYPTGGYVVSKTALGFATKVIGIEVSSNSVARHGNYLVAFDPQGMSLRIFTRSNNSVNGTYAEVTATTNLTGVQVSVSAIGY